MNPQEIDGLCVEIFAINGSLFNLARDLTANNQEIMRLLLVRNRMMRELGFIHGNLYLESKELCSFEEMTVHALSQNITFVLAIISPVLKEIIKNRPKDAPQLVAAANAFGRVKFLEQLEAIANEYKEFFDSDEFATALPKEATRAYIRLALKKK